MPIVYILTLVLLTSISQQCQPALYSLNLTTDFIQFSAAHLQNNAYNFTFRNPLTRVPQVALGITHLTTNSQNTLDDPQFGLFISSVTTRGVQIILNSQAFAWIISRVCLWASTNSQILLGYATIQNSKATSGASVTNLQFQIPINSALPVNNNQIARGFLNGLTARGRLVSATITSAAFNIGRLWVNINVQADQIDAVSISFMVFNLNNGEFAAYGGYISIGSAQSQTVDLLKGFSASQNVFFGINALQVDQKYSGLNVQTFIDSDFHFSYASARGSFVSTYIFIGYPGNFTCFSCRSNGQNYFLNNDCVSSCLGNTVPVALSNGGLMCRPCPAGSGLVAVRGSCVCPENYVFKVNKCVLVAQALQGIKVQLASSDQSNYQSMSASGAINILPSFNQNQNMAFTSVNSATVVPTVMQSVSSSSVSSTTSFQTQIQTSHTTQTQAQQNPSPSTIYGITSVSCPIPNSFFNGNECVCNVGFIYSNGQCMLTQIPITNVIPTKPQVSTNLTQICPVNAYFNGVSCVCNQGYLKVSNSCIQKVVCPVNSQDNGLGTCICLQNFTLVNNVCQPLTPKCPANSTLVRGTCSCNSGFYNISGTCSQCPVSSYWSTQAKKCVFICGVNAVYNETAKSCQCTPGFGLDASENCVICGNGFSPINGYCATCPNNAVYNANSQQCLCKTGSLVNPQGFCIQKCTNNEIYNERTSSCECVQNLARIGSFCSLCPSNSYFSNDQCIYCQMNAYLVNNRCICMPGFATDAYGVCQTCSSLPNAFIKNGICAKCQSNQVYNSTLGACHCPMGKTLSGNLCVYACNNDELMDKSGNCYTCGMNEVISNGACVCQRGFTRSSCGLCTVSCPTGSFVFMGTCAICPVSMSYLPSIVGCVCPNGFYMDPIAKVCAKSPFTVPNCSLGTFYDVNAQRCVPCAVSCTSCSNLNNCTSCARGYSLNNGICSAVCGDGIIIGSQRCDTGRTAHPGCAQCQITSGYTCSGQPSNCASITPNPNPIDQTNNNNPTPARLTLKGNISLNSNNIFITLLTNPTFTFPNPTVMQSFMQATFINTIRPAMYCVQEASPNLSTFNCLFIYPSGIPNTKFNVRFFFDYQGQSASLQLTIDPLLYVSSARGVTPGTSSRNG